MQIKLLATENVWHTVGTERKREKESEREPLVPMKQNSKFALPNNLLIKYLWQLVYFPSIIVRQCVFLFRFHFKLQEIPLPHFSLKPPPPPQRNRAHSMSLLSLRNNFLLQLIFNGIWWNRMKERKRKKALFINVLNVLCKSFLKCVCVCVCTLVCPHAKNISSRMEFQLRLKMAEKDLSLSCLSFHARKHIRKLIQLNAFWIYWSNRWMYTERMRRRAKKKVFDFVFIRDRLKQFIESLPNAIVSSLNK